MGFQNFIQKPYQEKFLPKRTKRFVGKYGKGIDFDSINKHSIRYHSLTGDLHVHNSFLQIKKEIERLRHNAAKKIYFG